jgi:hypothetical protein
MSESFPELIIRNHDDLADALLAIKNFLGLSNEMLEQIAGLTHGHCDKMLGPSREKTIGRNSFDLLLATLGIRLRVEIDEPQARLMQARYERRNDKQVRNRLSRAILDRARPIILAELGFVGEPQGHMNGNGYKG